MGCSVAESTVVRTRRAVMRGADYAIAADPRHELSERARPGPLRAPRYVSVPRRERIGLRGFVQSLGRGSERCRSDEVLRHGPTAAGSVRARARVCPSRPLVRLLPGPTWPNRMFAHAASSGGLDHSPSTAEILEWETLDGFAFPAARSYGSLAKQGVGYHFYSGDEFPMIAGLARRSPMFTGSIALSRTWRILNSPTGTCSSSRATMSSMITGTAAASTHWPTFAMAKRSSRPCTRRSAALPSGRRRYS